MNWLSKFRFRKLHEPQMGEQFFLQLPDKFLELVRRIESRIYGRPIYVLRTFSFFLIFITGISIWFGVTAHKRLSAIERTLGGQQSLGCSLQETVDRISSSVVRIVGGLGEGSGFAISQHHIVTNHHVIDGEPSPKIVYKDGSFENGVVVAADPDRDLAVIYVNRDLEPLKWVSWGTTQLGQALLIFGYPYGGSLNGQVTVNRATVAAFRGKRGQDEAQYVQTDGGVIDGMSGGPMVTLCGQAVAVNAAGGENMGIGIDADTTQNWIYSATSENPTEPWQEQEVANPDASALDAVKTYYGYISARNYKAAYEMLSDNFIGDVTYDNWANGFGTQLQTSVLSIKTDPANRLRVFVELGSTDLVDGDIVYHSFEGSWLVRKIDGHLRLWESNIKEITE